MFSPIDDAGTRPMTVSLPSPERTTDSSTALLPPVLNLINANGNNQNAILKTLVRLKNLAESGAAG
ncbi:MAG: hypothetical protein ISQ77_05075 [Candidatus Nanopelagicales bacterium]|nr:hypothetical protein [Candidatus Nanopelagicales bacterium]MBL6834705.1 hypothetical protein [Candidatus Nanopelagicales bacterium]